jgi:hypothetical protein
MPSTENINNILDEQALNLIGSSVDSAKFQQFVSDLSTPAKRDRVMKGGLYQDQVFRDFGLITAFPTAIVGQLLGQSGTPNPFVEGISVALVAALTKDAAGKVRQRTLYLVVGSCDGVGRFLFNQERAPANPTLDYLPVKKYPLTDAGSDTNAIEYQRLREGFLASSTALAYQGFEALAAANPASFKIPWADIFSMVYDGAPPAADEDVAMQVVLKTTDPAENVPPPKNQYFTTMAQRINASDNRVGDIVEGPTSPTFHYEGHN